MLDTFIIQRIREEEEERRRHRESRRPFLEIPVTDHDGSERTEERESPPSNRGVTIIEPDEE